MASMRAGENGMTLIEYIGGNVGKQSWWGPVTGTRYEFGGTKRVGYVDDRDLAAMLDVVQGRKPVFRRYVQPAQPVAVMAPDVPVDEPPMAPEIVATPAPVYEAWTETELTPENAQATAELAVAMAAEVTKPKRKARPYVKRSERGKARNV